MRPYAMTADRGLQPDMTAVLYAKRDDTTCGRGRWRLAWMRPGDSSYCYAEGECSAVYHRTRADAVAYGLRRYDERAAAWPRG